MAKGRRHRPEAAGPDTERMHSIIPDQLKDFQEFTEDLPKRTGYIINNNNFFSLHPRINYRVRFSLLFFTMTVNKQSSLQKLLAFETLLLICSTARAVPSQSH